MAKHQVAREKKLPERQIAGKVMRIFRVMITGGGTGGHIYPALAIAKGLKRHLPETEILYVGTSGGMEAKLIPAEGLPFKTVSAKGLERHLSWKSIKSLAVTGGGVIKALGLVRSFKPQVVVGTGGYVCFPVVLAASLLKVPTVIHEQNAFPGITNKILARFVNKVMITFPEAAKFFPEGADIVHTGLPVRPEIIAADRREAEKKLELSADAFHILVVGGSQGAKSINAAMVKVWECLAGRKDISVLHITGENGFFEARLKLAKIADNKKLAKEKETADSFSVANITIKPYLHVMENGLASADLVISRAGASFLAEIMVRGVPAILIPYPHAAENHQEYNARSLSDAGAAITILDKELNGTLLLKNIEALLANPGKLDLMASKSREAASSNALEKIVGVIMDSADLLQ